MSENVTTTIDGKVGRITLTRPKALHALTLEGTEGAVAILNVKDFPIIRQWYIVHPRGKELSLVARTFLDFAIASEDMIHDRMVSLWPGMKQFLSKPKKTAGSRTNKVARKKKAVRKKKR